MGYKEIDRLDYYLAVFKVVFYSETWGVLRFLFVLTYWATFTLHAVI